MTLEKSHGKARPTLPRSSDLADVPTGGDRKSNHAANGRFMPGNAAATDRSAKQAIGKVLGLRPTADAVSVVAKDAARVFGVVLRDMPSDAPTVRNLAAMLARHSALGAYFNVRADELGLDTLEGLAAIDQATKHGMRVERLTVTCLDVATRLTKASDRDPAIDIDAINRRANDNLERKRVAEQRERDAEEAAE